MVFCQCLTFWKHFTQLDCILICLASCRHYLVVDLTDIFNYSAEFKRRSIRKCFWQFCGNNHIIISFQRFSLPIDLRCHLFSVYCCLFFPIVGIEYAIVSCNDCCLCCCCKRYCFNSSNIASHILNANIIFIVCFWRQSFQRNFCSFIRFSVYCFQCRKIRSFWNFIFQYRWNIVFSIDRNRSSRRGCNYSWLRYPRRNFGVWNHIYWNQFHISIVNRCRLFDIPIAANKTKYHTRRGFYCLQYVGVNPALHRNCYGMPFSIMVERNGFFCMHVRRLNFKFQFHIATPWCSHIVYKIIFRVFKYCRVDFRA